MDIWVVLYEHSYTSLPVDICFYMSSEYLRVEILGHTLDVCLTLWGTVFKMRVLHASPSSSLSSLPWSVVILILAVLTGVKWHFIMILVCVSMMTKRLSAFSYAYWPFLYLLLWSTSHFRSFLIRLSFCYWLEEFFKHSSLSVDVVQIFASSLWAAFTFS